MTGSLVQGPPGDPPASPAPPPGRPPSPSAPNGAPVVHPRLWQRRMAVLRDQGHRRLRWVVGGVAVLVGLCVVVVVLHTPLLALRHATVVGAHQTGAAAVLAASGLDGHPPLIDVDPKNTAAQVEALPWVAHATVVRHWPDSVTITVTERVPLGAVPLAQGGVAVVDATGRVLAWQAGAPGLVLHTPAVPGRPGTVLARAARPALEVGRALPAAFAGRVRQVTVDARGAVTVDLGDRVTAALGSTQGLAAKLTALASVLAGAHVSGPAAIDVTVPDQPTVGPPSPTTPLR